MPAPGTGVILTQVCPADATVHPAGSNDLLVKPWFAHRRFPPMSVNRSIAPATGIQNRITILLSCYPLGSECRIGFKTVLYDP